MKVRSITCFYHPGANEASATLDQLAELAAKARTRFEQASFPVQSQRLASVPFPELCGTGCDDQGAGMTQSLAADARQHGFTYLSLGPALPSNPESFAMVPAMLAASPDVFLSASLLDEQGRISQRAVRESAAIMQQAATLEPNGFANLRFAAIANVQAFTPFFPAGYSAGDQPAFALAMECADTFLDAFQQARTLDQAGDSALASIEKAAAALTAIAEKLAEETGIAFKGFDFSPAPYPAEFCSLGRALEALGLPALGMSGSAAAAAFTAGLLDRGKWLHAGFNGLMLPVLEDSGLAARSSDGTLTIKDLLLYSCLCGTGLDTVPLPGDASEAQLSALLLDLAAISTRLRKPLTARLMPIPGKQAGDPVTFDFEYLAPGRVMALPAEPLSGALAGSETLGIHPR